MHLTPERLRTLLAATPALEFRVLQIAHQAVGTPLSDSTKGLIVGALLAVAVADGEVPCEELNTVLLDTMSALTREEPRDLDREPWKALDLWIRTLRNGQTCLTGKNETGTRVVTSPVLQFLGANLAVTRNSVYRLGTPA